MQFLEKISIYWRAQIIGWTLFAVISMVERQLLYHSASRAIIITVIITPIMFILSEILRRIYSNQYFNRGLRVGSTLVTIIMCLCAGLSSTLLIVVIFEVKHWSIPGWELTERIAIPFVQNWLIFTGWSLAYFWIKADIRRQYQAQRAARAESEKLKFELQKLRLQLNPHFLFNALNGVMEQVPENTDIALNMLRHLTDYLRYSLRSIDETIVKVQSEVDAIVTYLAIQEARFGPRLSSRVIVAPDALDRLIVSYLLQPLVENAIKHGSRDNVLNLSIEINMVGLDLKIDIINTGHLSIKDNQYRNRTPVGLINLKQRLALHYPNRHSFDLYQQTDDAVVASLKLVGSPCLEF